MTIHHDLHMARLRIARLEEALKKAYFAGFDASGEGWNGEYPFYGFNVKTGPEENAHWLARRGKDLAEIVAAVDNNTQQT